MAPIFAHSKIRRYELHDKLLSLQCKEDFPSPEWNYAFTGIFLFVQYILPLIIIPFVHSKIVIFLRYVSNWNFSCYICTMLQKLSNCEVKAWLCWNLIILLPLRFYVKSNFGEFKQSKNVVFGNIRGSEFWFVVNLSNFQVQNLPKFIIQCL